MDRQAGSKPGDQTIQQTNPMRGRQGIRNPRYSPRSKHRVIRFMVNIQSRESLAKHTRQSGEEQMIVDRYKYTEPNAEMSCRCRDGRRVTGERDEEIAGHVGVAGSEMTGDDDKT